LCSCLHGQRKSRPAKGRQKVSRSNRQRFDLRERSPVSLSSGCRKTLGKSLSDAEEESLQWEKSTETKTGFRRCSIRRGHLAQGKGPGHTDVCHGESSQRKKLPKGNRDNLNCLINLIVTEVFLEVVKWRVRGSKPSDPGVVLTGEEQIVDHEIRGKLISFLQELHDA